MAFSLLMAAIAPGLALLAYFYLKDLYESEPISMVARMFVLGILTVFPTMVVQRGFVLGLGENPLLFAFGISAGIEEFIKWFLVYFLIFRNSSIKQPYDGIVYATAVSLGFATLENVLFSWFYQPSISTLLYRAMLPVSGHALFGVVMGYYLGKAKSSPEHERKYVTYALLLPIFWHGSFDYILSQANNYWLWLIAPFMFILWVRGIRKVNRANRMPIIRQRL
ncbi:MAG: glutamic-type intramembrane protease PrsW [Paenibacillaceae bacterium]